MWCGWSPQMVQCGLEAAFGGGVCHACEKPPGTHNYQGLNTSTSACLTAAPLLYEDKTSPYCNYRAAAGLLWHYGSLAFMKFAVWCDRCLYVHYLSDKVCLAMTVPVEELLCEAVLHVAGRRLLLDTSLQQHLLVHLPLLLLLLQVLLHTKTLPVVFFILLRWVPKLRITHDDKQRKHMENLICNR